MNSALLALFTRALREDTRAKFMYWARAGLVGIVLVDLGITQASMGWAGAPGLQFFNSIVFIDLFFISLAGLSYFSSAITEEKEEQTLGLLRMTNLNPLAILLGKSASRQVGALLLLASQVPFTLLAVALGGVTIWQILAAYACLAAYTIFLGNLALFFSVITPRTALAAILTGVTLFLFLFGAGIIRGMVVPMLQFARVVPAEGLDPRLTAFLTGWEQTSPIERLTEISLTGFHEGAFCFQVASNLGLGLVCFLLAWAVFDVFCNEQLDVGPTRGLIMKSGKPLRIFVAGRPWRRALAWKDFHFIGGGRAVVLGKLIAYGCLLAAVVLIQRRFDTMGIRWNVVGYTAVWTMLFAFSVEGAFVAARVFRQERRWKTWSSLAMLPVSTGRIAFEKLVGCFLACWPALIFLIAGVVIVAPEVYRELIKNYSRPDAFGGQFEWMAIGAIGYTFLQVIFFYYLVADLSLRLKWGALPLALALTYIGTMFMTMMGFLMFKDGAFVLLILGAIGGIAFLQFDIIRRLEHIAAED